MDIQLSVVIPTFNESKNIEMLIERLDKALGKTSHELIVVDDNSPDRTWEIAEGLTKKYCVRVIRRIGEKGLASAVLKGMRESKGAFICVMDSDLSHPPEVVPIMLAKIKEKNDTEAVIASRYMQSGSVEKWPLHRKIISMGATLMVRPIVSISDPMSGFFLVRTDKLNLDAVDPIGYKIMLEVLVKSRLKKIEEIPYTFTNRAAGRSNLGLQQYWEYLIQLRRLYGYTLTSHPEKGERHHV